MAYKKASEIRSIDS